MRDGLPWMERVRRGAEGFTEQGGVRGAGFTYLGEHPNSLVIVLPFTAVHFNHLTCIGRFDEQCSAPASSHCNIVMFAWAPSLTQCK